MFSNTKKIILIALLSLLNNFVSLSQTFIKITEGEFVNEEYNLEQNYPNPFNPITKISSRQSAVGKH